MKFFSSILFALVLSIEVFQFGYCSPKSKCSTGCFSIGKSIKNSQVSQKLAHLFSHRTELSKIYDEINNHMYSESAGENMRDAIFWLEHEISAGSKNRHLLVKAMDLLNHLKMLENDQHCDSTSKSILLANEQAIKGAKKESSPVRRIDKTVKYYIDRHRQACREAPSREDLDNSFVSEMAEGYIKGVVNNILAQQRDGGNILWERVETKSLIKELLALCHKKIDINELTTIHSLEGLKNPIKILRFLANKDPNRHYLYKNHADQSQATVDQPKLVFLFHKHMVEPCEHYLVNHYSEWQQPEVAKSRAQNQESTLDSYIVRAHYQFCKALVIQSQGLMVERLVRAIQVE